MKTLRPSAKIGIVLLGLALALVIAWVAVEARDRFSPVPAVEKGGGMYGFGSLLLGIAVFGMAALVPIGLALYWLRPVEAFWRRLGWFAIVWALSGFVAVAINHWSQPPLGGWTLWANMRFGIMPLSALGLLTAAVFAPLPGNRWLLASAAACDALLFVAVIVVKLLASP